MKKRYLYIFILSVSCMIALTFHAAANFDQHKANGKELKTSISPDTDHLPVVGSAERLQEILQEAYETYAKADVDVAEEAAFDAVNSAESLQAISSENAQKVNAGADHFSTTNVQVQGVDEADIVKTDGTYLYQIVRNQVVISKIYPVEQMQTVDTLTFDQHFHPRELYIDQDHLIVIGRKQGYQLFPAKKVKGKAIPVRTTEQGVAEQSTILPTEPARIDEMTVAYVYDIQDQSHFSLQRTLALQGSYLTSRKKGSALYFVTNQYLYYDDDQNDKAKEEVGSALYLDSAVSSEDQYQTVDYDRLYYFPESHYASYLNILGVDLAESDQAADVQSFLGAGSEIYGSPEHLYIVSSNVHHSEEENNTSIYKFSWNQGKVKYEASGNVSGRLLNQFSMDEYDGHFRVATTTGQMWNDQSPSKNHLFVLDQNMNVVGQVNDLAPGERIYSVRFMGERGYMVTYRTVDPLFVIDLKQPDNPTVLGELKIPGFSDYLHPIDEHHLLGFGKETEAFIEEDAVGNVREFAIDKGMKISLFDVSDPLHPKEKFIERMGDRGTYSELLNNHKALMYSEEEQFFAFPIQIWQEDKGDKQKHPFEIRSEFAFQGALIYDIDSDQGFRQRGSVSHMLENSANDKMFHLHDQYIQRVLYIGDTLYTVSNHAIKANDLSTLEEQQTLFIKK